MIWSSACDKVKKSTLQGGWYNLWLRLMFQEDKDKEPDFGGFRDSIEKTWKLAEMSNQMCLEIRDYTEEHRGMNEHW